MLKALPVEQGPLTGQTFFPEIDELSPTAKAAIHEHRTTPVAKMGKKLKTRLQLKEGTKKVEKKFPDDADINPDLTSKQRQRVIEILESFRDVFVPEGSGLPCTDLVEHRIDTGDAPPIYIPP